MSREALDTIYDRLEGVRRRPTWPFLLGAAALAFVIGALAGPPEPPKGVPIADGVPYALGQALVESFVIGAMVAAALYFLFVRRRNPGAAAAHFLILWLVAYSPQLAFGALMLSRAGELEASQAFIDEHRAAMTAARATYEAELKASGVETILAPVELVADPNLRRTNARLERAARALETYRVAVVEIGRRRSGQVRSLEISGAAAAELRDAFREEDRLTAAAVARDGAILAEYRAVAEILARGHWQVSRGKVLFDRNADLQAVAMRLERAKRLAAETSPAGSTR